MDVKRVASFFIIVVISLVVIGWTSPGIIKNIRLGLDLKGGFEILYLAEPLEAGQKVTGQDLIETARSLEKRANEGGVEEPEVLTEGEDRIRVRIAGVDNPEQLKESLKKPSELTFRGPDGTKELLGSDFVAGGAKVEYNETGQPYISIQLKSAEKFKNVTTKLVGQTLGIYMDEEMLSNPGINQVINSDKAIIEGRFTFEEAKSLAGVINLGALPLKLTEKYSQSVGATLGKESLDLTVRGGVIGSLLVLIFMIFFYRIPGLIACFTLLSYVWLLLLAFNLMNATLTLPGIAAFVLGIGMAVDANIITYERIKEEIRSGKSMLSSLKAGSRNSFRAIIDANVTTIIAALVLYNLGTGAIQGFAFVLIMSILVSILTNVFFSRLLMYLLIRGKMASRPAHYGVRENEISEL